MTNNEAGVSDLVGDAEADDNSPSNEESNTETGENNSNTAAKNPEKDEGNVADNVFAILFDEVKKYLSEILCTLTLVSSIIVAFAYKRGLVPIVEGGVGAISRAVAKIKERGEESDKEAKNNYDNLTRSVSEYENTLVALGDKVGDLTLAVAPLGEELKNNKLIEALIVSQTNMLYEVFMASSLPAYQKDKVEAHFKKMMEDLKGEK